jgi:PITH domain
MDCGHEAHDHDHSEGHHHEHDHDKAERGLEMSLYHRIDTSKVVCLNESEDGQCRRVFKAWDKRLDRTEVTFN